MNNKKFMKRGPQGEQLLFLYEVSIVVLIDFIAILLTPGIFLIQIVNTNMHLIHFYSKNNIKMHIPKSWVLKFQNCIRHSLSITTGCYKLHWQEKSLLSNIAEPDFQKCTIKHINFTHNVILCFFLTLK